MFPFSPLGNHLLDSFLQMISPGFLSHSPVAKQMAVIIPSGKSSSSHWKVTCVPGIAGTEWSLMVPFHGGDSGTVQFIGAVSWKNKFLYNQELNSRVVGGSVGNDVHSIASGSGLHINVLSHVTIVTGNTYSTSHWMVTEDPGNLLETGPKASFMGLVNTVQPPA